MAWLLAQERDGQSGDAASVATELGSNETGRHHSSNHSARSHRADVRGTTKCVAVEQTPEQKIEVPDHLGKTHRLLSGQLTEWRSASVDEYGAIRSGSLRQRNIRVSKQHLSRALRIMNTLFVALEARDHQVGIQDGYKKTLGVRINGQPVECGLKEKFQRINRPEDKSRRPDPWVYHRYEYIPTGTLILKITESGGRRAPENLE